MTLIGSEWLAALAGVAFVVMYVAALGLGIEVGDSDREILAYYARSGHRAKEIVAFFLIGAAALALVVFVTALRSLIARAGTAMLAALAGAGGIACAVLVLAGNAVSRATAYAALDDGFRLAPNTQRLFEATGFLLFVSGTLAAIVLVIAVSLAAPRYGVVPRWLGGLPSGGAADTRDRVRRLPRLRCLGDQCQRRTRHPPLRCDGGPDGWDALNA